MHFSPSPDHQVHVELVIEPQKRGWFNRKQNIDEVELDSRTRGNRLILTQDNEETRTIWRVQLPVLVQTNIDFGVGEVKGVFGATELDVDLGVGDVDVELPLASTGQVTLSAGVGDTRLDGGNNTTVDRTFVSHEVRGRGDGNFDVNIEVGVGDVEASLR